MSVSTIYFTKEEVKALKSTPTHWFNKKIVWLGTSIPENALGEGVDQIERVYNSYPNQLGRTIGANMFNHSRAGLASALSTDGTIYLYGSLVAYLSEYADPAMNVNSTNYTSGRNVYRSFENALLGQSADLYVFDLVPNNANFGTSEWDKFSFSTLTFSDGSTFDDNRTTYLGSILFLYNKLMQENPLARVVFVTEYPTEHAGVQDTILASEKLNIPLINLREKLGTDNGWHSTQYIVDGTHPSQYAVDRMAEMLFGEFLRIS